MQNLEPHPRPTESESAFEQEPRGFIFTLKFGMPWWNPLTQKLSSII